MASDPFSFHSPFPLFSASAVANSPRSPPSTPHWSRPSTPHWLSLLPHILVIVVISATVFCCCNCLGTASHGRISRRRSDIESRFSSRGRRRQVEGAVVSKTFRYNEEEPAGKNTECCVCLDDFKDGDLCRMLSTCDHNFHEPCINHWLKISSHCPLCRVSVRRERRTDRSQAAERSSSSDSTAEPPV